MTRLLTLLALAVAADWRMTQARQAVQPSALAPACDTIRVHHPDKRRLVRVIDCVTGDTTVERGRP